MGDRCYVSLTYRDEDAALVHEHLEAPEDAWEAGAPPGCTTGGWTEMNYAATDARDALAALGVPFVGWHGEGGEYGPMIFAAVDGAMLEVDASHDNEPVIRVDPAAIDDQGRVLVPRDVRAFFAHQARAVAVLATTGPTEGIAARALGAWLGYYDDERWRGQDFVSFMLRVLCALCDAEILSFGRLPHPEWEPEAATRWIAATTEEAERRRRYLAERRAEDAARQAERQETV